MTALDQKQMSDLNPDRVILFDGVCNLCNFWVNLVLRMDRRKKFRFASLQSRWAEKVLQKKYPGILDQDSVVYFENGVVWIKSDAILRISMELFRFRFLFSLFKWIPGKYRDGIYDFIARNRYDWFGKKEVCRIPTEEERDLFYE